MNRVSKAAEEPCSARYNFSRNNNNKIRPSNLDGNLFFVPVLNGLLIKYLRRALHLNYYTLLFLIRFKF